MKESSSCNISYSTNQSNQLLTTSLDQVRLDYNPIDLLEFSKDGEQRERGSNLLTATATLQSSSSTSSDNPIDSDAILSRSVQQVLLAASVCTRGGKRKSHLATLTLHLYPSLVLILLNSIPQSLIQSQPSFLDNSEKCHVQEWKPY